MSEIVDESSPAVEETAPVPPLGEQLKAQREAKAMSVEDVARALKLQPRQIVAAEHGDFSAIGGTPFLRGFIKNYARCVGFDSGVLIQEVAPAPRKVEEILHGGAGARVPMPNPGRKKPWNWLFALSPLLLVGIGALILLATGFQLESWFKKSANADMPKASSAVPLNQIVQPLPAVDQPPSPPQPTGEQSKLPDAGGAGTASGQGAVAAPPTPSPSVGKEAQSPQVPGVQNGQAPAAPAGPQAEVKPNSQSTPQPTPQSIPKDGLHALRLTAETDSWIEVKSENKVIYSQKLGAGQMANLQGKAPFLVVIGNAKGAHLFYDNQEVGLEPFTKVNVSRVSLN